MASKFELPLSDKNWTEEASERLLLDSIARQSSSPFTFLDQSQLLDMKRLGIKL